MTRFILVALLALHSVPAKAKESLICQVSARVPYSAAIRRDARDTRIFTQEASLIEERRSGASAIRHWNVIGDSPQQLIATNPDGATTLIIDWPGATFAESGLLQQQRGYCRINELP